MDARRWSERVGAAVVLAAIAVFVAAAPAWSGSAASAPEPEYRPVESERFGDVRVDPYAWMRDREDPAVIAHLERENAYVDAVLGHTAALQETLYRETLERIDETDEDAPLRDDDWLYYTRTEEGRDYPLYCRRPYPDGEERVYLDVNELAEPHVYYEVTALARSTDHGLLAYLEDTEGDDVSTLRIREMESGRVLPVTIEGVSSFGVAWDATGEAVYYLRPDETKRPYQVWRHRVGTSPGDDELLYQEDDARFFVGIERSRSDAFLVIGAVSGTTGEMRVVDAHDASAQPRLLIPRRDGVLVWSVDHMRGEGPAEPGFFYAIDDAGGARDGRLIRRRDDARSDASWEVVEEETPGVHLLGVDITASHIIVSERRDGFRTARVMGHDRSGMHRIAIGEPVSAMYATGGPMYETDRVRVRYTSPLVPMSTYDYRPATREAELLKRVEVPGGFDFGRYAVERLEAVAPDGVRVPVTVIRSKDAPLDGTTPALLMGYGAYGISMEPWFTLTRRYAGLLERGMTVAVAHVRGGGEMGRRWHDGGRFLDKPNTFTDFIACAEALFAGGYTSAERLAIQGASAGGLLVGAVINLRPDIAAVAIAEVPFVDSLNTMLDDTLPLTTFEYKEWGDPSDERFYRCMRSYAPYEQIGPRDYPDVLATAGLNDPRVGFWEPAKWVSRLRDRRTDDGLTLLRTRMAAGHAGASGLYDALRERAEVEAFVLDRLGLVD